MPDPTQKPDLNNPAVLDKEIEAPHIEGALKAPTFFERIQAFFSIPLFRNYVVIILVLVLFVAAGFAYIIGFSKHTTDVESALKQTQTDIQDKEASEEKQPTSETSPDPTPAPTPAPSVSTPDKPCGVAGMPQGVCDAITSIEKDGLKGNSYVTANTTSLPEGTKAVANRSSWKQTAPEFGSLEGTISYGGKEYKGTLLFQVLNGKWVVNSYTTQQ